MAVSQEARRYGVIRESVIAAIVGSTAATVLSLGLLVLRPPGYRAVAEIRFDVASKTDVDDLAGAAVDLAMINRLRRKERIDSDPAFRRLPLDRFVDCLGPTPDTTACTDKWLGVVAVDDKSLRISVTSTDPDRSAAVANRLANLVIDQRQARDDTAARAKALEVAEAERRATAPSIEAPAVKRAAEEARQRQAEAEREAAARAEREAALKAEAARRRSDAEAALARRTAELAQAEDLVRTTKTAVDTFQQANPNDPTLASRLAAAREAAAARQREASAAKASLAELSGLKQQTAAAILADSALAGPAFADLRSRHAAARELERTLATQLLDRHPTLIDARERLRSIENEVLQALARLITDAAAAADAANAADDAARKVVAALESDEAREAKAAADLAGLRALAADADAAYTSLKNAPPPVIPPEKAPVVPLPEPTPAPNPPVPVETANTAPATTNEAPAVQNLTRDPPPAPVETAATHRPILVAAQPPLRPLGLSPVILLTSAGLLGGALGLLMGGLGAHARRVSRR